MLTFFHVNSNVTYSKLIQLICYLLPIVFSTQAIWIKWLGNNICVFPMKFDGWYDLRKYFLDCPDCIATFFDDFIIIHLMTVVSIKSIRPWAILRNLNLFLQVPLYLRSKRPPLCISNFYDYCPTQLKPILANHPLRLQRDRINIRTRPYG